MTRQVAVIGGGIVGVAVAHELMRRCDIAVTILEKENQLGLHQTGHNSGVVHSGFNYLPGSLKASLCRRGVTLLKPFCENEGIPYIECGKVVVATTATESDRLDDLLARAQSNGVPGVRLLDASELAKREPHVSGLRALLSPTSAIVDFVGVTRRLAANVEAAGGSVRTGVEVTGVEVYESEAVVTTPGGTERFDLVISCAGLQSDKLGEMCSGDPEPRIVPFRGDYYGLKEHRRTLVNGLVYPVADPRYPFLGVHITPQVGGDVLLGPNAVLAMAREGYGWRDISIREMYGLVRHRGFRAFAREHWKTGVSEVYRALSRKAFVNAARNLIPEIGIDDVERRASGVRAQALAMDGAMIDDFVIVRRGAALAVRNAPSPAATSALAIAEYLVDRVLEMA